MSKPAQFDVFVMHGAADRPWVRDELLPRLQRAGLKACTVANFEPGAPSVNEMERLVTTSRKTLLVLTPAYLEHEWNTFGDSMLQSLDPAARDRRLIPLIKAACELPLRIGYLTPVDFTESAEYVIAWRQLLTALGAPPVLQAPAQPAREHWSLYHPYAMPPNFTGRRDEHDMLSQWLDTDGAHPLLLIRALGGFGKSALTWHWLLHDVDPERWPRVLWWSFYETSADFDSFLRESLAYLGVDPIPAGPRPQADALLQQLRQPGVLLVLDGFERALRAFSGMGAAYQGDEEARTDDQTHERDCVSPIAEHFLRSIATLPGMRGKVLMTTRLRPRVLESHGGMLLQGCCEQELTAMYPADAVAFFWAQGIRGTRAEIEQACERYGYHPLSLRLLAGLVVNDFQQRGDIAAAQRLDVGDDLKQRQHHVLEQAYNSLTLERRKLLSRIACFRGTVEYKALRALADKNDRSFDAALHDLIARGLLQRDQRINLFDLHPLVRRYAYDRLNSDERIAAHNQLHDYFAAVPVPRRVQRLEELMPLIELYHHMIRAGKYDEALAIFRHRIHDVAYYQFGAYELQIELLSGSLSDDKTQLPLLSNEDSQAWVLAALANSYSLRGQSLQAILLYKRQADIREKQGEKRNIAVGLRNLADDQLKTGGLHAAEENLRRSNELCREVEDIYGDSVGHQELGRLLMYRGFWDESKEELRNSTSYWQKTNDVQGLCMDEAYRAQMALLMNDVEAALGAAQRSLELADETAYTHYPHQRDYTRGYWLLGAAYRTNGNLAEADQHLTVALARCRSINMVDHEADILLELAKLRAAQGHRDEALTLAQEALLITERSGYVLQGADVNLFLAQMAQETSDAATALKHALEARKLATCDGPPDYTYKVAYDQAGKLLTELGAPRQE